MWFVAAGVLLNLTPGPDVLCVVSHSLRYGRRAGMTAALGIACGCCVHIVAAALGLSAILMVSSTAFAVLKYLGAAYLLWVGLRMLFASAPTVWGGVGAWQQRGLWQIFWRGFATNALNPKVALFFLAFLPQFLSPNDPHQTRRLLLLGLLFNFNGLWVDLGWAMLAAWVRERTAVVQRGLRWLDRIAGVLFMGFGLRLALLANPAH